MLSSTTAVAPPASRVFVCTSGSFRFMTSKGTIITFTPNSLGPIECVAQPKSPRQSVSIYTTDDDDYAFCLVKQHPTYELNDSSLQPYLLIATPCAVFIVDKKVAINCGRELKQITKSRVLYPDFGASAILEDGTNKIKFVTQFFEV